ncbi:MAG: UTP--glucose-1-phosphate uridylyltransferase GalU [Minisyncoccia bacterium]
MKRQNIIKKAIIPVAGLGTRFLPATKSQPKEMLPIIDKPVVHFIVEEAIRSGIEDIIFITGRHKRAIEDYFDYTPELENNLLQKNKIEIFNNLRSIAHMANFIYVRQKEQKGDGDAILQAECLIKNEPFAVLFGDDIIDSKKPALLQLIEIFEKYRDCVVALGKVPKKDLKHYGVVKVIKVDKNVYEIKDIVEKPEPNYAPSNLAIIGKYILIPEILNELKNIKNKNEIRIADALKSFLKKRPIYGVKIEGKRYDCGSKIGFVKAIIEFGLKHPEIKRELKNYIKSFKF